MLWDRRLGHLSTITFPRRVMTTCSLITANVSSCVVVTFIPMVLKVLGRTSSVFVFSTYHMVSKDYLSRYIDISNASIDRPSLECFFKTLIDSVTKSLFTVNQIPQCRNIICSI